MLLIMFVGKRFIHNNLLNSIFYNTIEFSNNIKFVINKQKCLSGNAAIMV